MLIVRSAFAKILPKSMHSRWDTWASVWLPEPVPHTMAATFGATLISSPIQAAIPGLYGALCCVGMLGLSTSVIAWNKRNQKEWTLPHEQWQTACAKVETKLRGIVHMPHLYRMGALCDLSFVLKDAEMERLATVAKQLKSLGLLTEQIVTADWTEGYTSGNVSATMLKPDVLGDVHKRLDFTALDIDQFVEANYIKNIYLYLKNPLPGTINALTKMADENPAILALYLQRNPTYTKSKKNYDSPYILQWDDDASSAWFINTHWPKTVELMHQIHAQMSTKETSMLSAMQLYREVMNAESAHEPLDFDGGIFEMDTLSV